MPEFPIFAKDLNAKTQKELCEFYGVKSVEDRNWDIIPITVLHRG